MKVWKRWDQYCWKSGPLTSEPRGWPVNKTSPAARYPQCIPNLHSPKKWLISWVLIVTLRQRRPVFSLLRRRGVEQGDLFKSSLSMVALSGPPDCRFYKVKVKLRAEPHLGVRRFQAAPADRRFDSSLLPSRVHGDRKGELLSSPPARSLHYCSLLLECPCSRSTPFTSLAPISAAWLNRLNLICPPSQYHISAGA